MLPSLLAANNLPAISKQYNVILLIHCDAKTKKLIAQSANYKKIEKYAKVAFCVFPWSLMQMYHLKSAKISSIYPQIRYLLLGVCQTHAFKVALSHKACLSYLMPDVVLSDSFFQHAFSKIEGKRIVFTTTYRSNYQGVYSELDHLYAASGVQGELAITGDKLLELQIKHIHPYELKRIVSTQTENFSPSARLIFKNKNGFIFRCFHYHPVIINCSNLDRHIKLDYLPIDNTALNDVLDSHISYEKQAWICTNPSQMAIMELSDEAPEMKIILNKTTLNYEQLVSQVHDLLINAPTIFNTAFNQFLAGFRHEFVVPDYANTLALGDDLIDDEKFFNDIKLALSTVL